MRAGSGLSPGYSANGLGYARLPLISYGAWPGEVSARGCSGQLPVPGARQRHSSRRGTGDAAQQHGLQATSTTSTGKQEHHSGARAGAEEPLR